MRPEGADALLQLSQRTKLALRLPGHRLDAAAALLGRTLHVAGWPLRVEKMALRPLSRITTLFSRCVVLADARDEAAFLAAAAGELGALGINPGRMVCGRVTPVATPERTCQTRSLMLAGLTLEQSLLLQQTGLGAGRKLGCGLFIPHKDIADLRSRSE
jgi:CRISPR-associated protein Cas6